MAEMICWQLSGGFGGTSPAFAGQIASLAGGAISFNSLERKCLEQVASQVSKRYM